MEFCPGRCTLDEWRNRSASQVHKESTKCSRGDEIMDFSELQTVMYQAAQIVSQRPIGRHPTHPDDGSYLCSNDLLLGRASPEIQQGPFKQRASDRYRLDFIQQVVQGFWKKWTRDYFPGWHVERRNVKKGDVVLIQDSNAVRGNCKIGILTEVHPSHDKTKFDESPYPTRISIRMEPLRDTLA